MKTLVWITFLLLCAIAPKAQMDHHFGPQDPRPPRIPAAFTSSSQQIAAYLSEHYATEDARIAAAYAWVTANINYSKDSMLAINWSLSTADKVAATLRRRKGVCDNFASLFADILLKMNIPSFVVNGLAKANGNTRAHSWTAVKLGGEWYLCDPTWDAGNNNRHFYMIPPQEFISAHWPFDPLWQLLPKTVSLQQFENGFAPIQSNETTRQVRDEVEAFLGMDSLQQLRAQEKRMRSIGLEQSHLRNWYAYNNMNIAIILGEQDMNHFNAAVAALNNANAQLNHFVEYRNNAFLPALPDAALTALLAPVEGFLQNASNSVAQVSKGRENFQYHTGALADKIVAMQKKLRAQQDFLNLYLSSDAAQRQRLFYK